MKFKRNDVIEYRYRGNLCEAIVRRGTKDNHMANISAARVNGGPWKLYSPKNGKLPLADGDITEVRLHPDADAVWASYVAELLCPASSVSL
jgi:hypothetical protein